MSPGSPSVEMRIPAASGRETRIRVGGFGAVLLAIGGLLIVAALVAAAALVPSSLARARERRAMNTALERRTQLGERLRAFVGSYQELERQVKAHSDLVERIRALYGLPELPAPRIERPPRARPSGIFAGAVLQAERLHAAVEGNLARTDATIAVLARWEGEHPAEVRAIPVVAPLRAGDIVQTGGYGPQRNPVSGEPEFHCGIDFAAPDGEPIRASAAGVVRWAGDAPTNAGGDWWRLGRIVVIAHGDEYRTIYGHCDRLLVGRGRRVAAGETIALVGRSGWTQTPRLHFEIRRQVDDEWVPVDPARLLLDLPLTPVDVVRRATLFPELPPPARLPRSFAR